MKESIDCFVEGFFVGERDFEIKKNSIFIH